MSTEVITTSTMLDDCDALDGVRTEAAVTAVIELDGQRVTLDLTIEHRAELGEAMARWLAAGTPVTVTVAVPQPSGRRNVTASTSGSPEAAQYRADLRAWADEQDRTDDYRVPRADGAGHTYIYSKQLKADFAAAQAAEAAQAAATARAADEQAARAAAERVASAEPEAPAAPARRRAAAAK